MKTLELDESNNIIIKNGNFKVLEGLPAIAQSIKNQISLIAKENPFNTKDGIDYFNQELGKMGGIEFLKSEIKAVILKNKDVLEVSNFNLSRDKTNLLISIDIKTKQGDFSL